MKIQAHPRDRLCAQLGYLDTEGAPSERAIASLLREPLNRWGLSPKRAVLKHARTQFQAVGIDEGGSVSRVLQRMVDIGECEELHVGQEAYLAPAMLRCMQVGADVFAYLGVSEPPDGLALQESEHRDIVRRIRINTEDDVAILELAGAKEASFGEWLTPLGYLRHASRKKRATVRSDVISLEGFWKLLENTLSDEGMMLGADAEVRFLRGNPGGHFGRHNAAQLEGRWTDSPEEGIWCAYRRGYGDAHWHPCIVSVAGGNSRVLDLYDDDEWKWAALARGRCLGEEEIVLTNDQKVKLTFPAPRQLSAAMDILGCPSGAWEWELNPDAPDLWRIIH